MMEDNAENNVLTAAKEAVDNRATNYGKTDDPTASVPIAAALWSAYLGVTITDNDFCMMQSLLKIARNKVDPSKRDNLVDQAGYARVAELRAQLAAKADKVTTAPKRNPASLK